MKIRKRHFQLVGVLIFCCMPSYAASEAPSWKTEISESDEILMHFPRSLVRNISMNHTPVREVINELCKRAGKKAIMDKSVDGKFVTAQYTDSTLAEILSEVFASTDLQAKYLTDNILLVEAKNAPKIKYTPKNIGDSDSTPPLSIEIQRLARIREANRIAREAKEAREARLQQQAYYGAYYGTRYQLVPPPPPMTVLPGSIINDFREPPTRSPKIDLPPEPQ